MTTATKCNAEISLSSFLLFYVSQTVERQGFLEFPVNISRRRLCNAFRSLARDGVIERYKELDDGVVFLRPADSTIISQEKRAA